MVKPRQVQLEDLNGDTQGLGSSNEVVSLTGTGGIVDSGGSRFSNTIGITMEESNSVPGGNPSAGSGTIWLKDTNPTTIVFTDSAGNEIDLTDPGVTSHDQLSGLQNDDHTQYLLANGSRPMSGDLNLDSNNILNIGSLSASGALITTSTVNNIGNIFQEQNNVPGGVPSAGFAKLWVRDTDPQLLVLTTEDGFDREIAFALGVSDNTLAKVLNTENTTDGYDIDVNNGSRIISSDGLVLIGNDTQIDGDGYVTGNFEIDGKLTVYGLIDPTGMVFDIQSSIPTEPSAGKGILWVKNDGFGKLIFTDENGDDFELGSGGGNQDLNNVLFMGNVTDGYDILISTGDSITGDTFTIGDTIEFKSNVNDTPTLTLSNSGNSGSVDVFVGSEVPSIFSTASRGSLYIRSADENSSIWINKTNDLTPPGFTAWLPLLTGTSIQGAVMVSTDPTNGELTGANSFSYDFDYNIVKVRSKTSGSGFGSGPSGFGTYDNTGSLKGWFGYTAVEDAVTLSSEDTVNGGSIIGSWEVPPGSTLSAEMPYSNKHVATKEYVDGITGNLALSSVLYNGNNTDGYDIVVSSGDSITGDSFTIGVINELKSDDYTTPVVNLVSGSGENEVNIPIRVGSEAANTIPTPTDIGALYLRVASTPSFANSGLWINNAQTTGTSNWRPIPHLSGTGTVPFVASATGNHQLTLSNILSFDSAARIFSVRSLSSGAGPFGFLTNNNTGNNRGWFGYSPNDNKTILATVDVDGEFVGDWLFADNVEVDGTVTFNNGVTIDGTATFNDDISVADANVVVNSSVGNFSVSVGPQINDFKDSLEDSSSHAVSLQLLDGYIYMGTVTWVAVEEDGTVHTAAHFVTAMAESGSVVIIDDIEISNTSEDIVFSVIDDDDDLVFSTENQTGSLINVITRFGYNVGELPAPPTP